MLNPRGVLKNGFTRLGRRSFCGTLRTVAPMKQFSHPGSEDPAPIDLEHVIDATLRVCRNEYKYSEEGSGTTLRILLPTARSEVDLEGEWAREPRGWRDDASVPKGI
jgi:hypothetical protein